MAPDITSSTCMDCCLHRRLQRCMWKVWVVPFI